MDIRQRVNMDEEEKRRMLEASIARRQNVQAQSYIKKTTQGEETTQTAKRETINLAQHKPEDITSLSYRMPEGERQGFIDYAQKYYESVGASGIPKSEDVKSQWSAWDAQRESAAEQRRIEKEQRNFSSTLGATGNLPRLEVLSAISAMEDDGEKETAMKSYATLTGTKGSVYYSPYAKATSEALKTLGVEAVDDNWFAKNAGLERGLLKNAYTGKVEKPGNSATQEQKNAYAAYILRGNEQTTKDAEQEMKTLYDDVARKATTYSGFDISAYIEGIDWKEYPTLEKMMDGAKTGEYVQLNRAVPFSMEALYGVAYCAKNGIEPEDAREYELYAGAWVNALKKEATLGTDEEEPEGFFAGILDTLSGEEKKRVQRKEQGEAARETLDALGIGYTLEKKETEAAQEVNADGSIVIHPGEETKRVEKSEQQEPESVEKTKTAVWTAGMNAPSEEEKAQEEKSEQKTQESVQKTTPTGWIAGLNAPSEEEKEQEEKSEQKTQESVQKTTPTGWIAGLNAQSQEEAKPQEEKTEEKTQESVQKTTPTGWMKERTAESKIKAFQGGSYAFVESAQDRSALRRIDAQIATLEQEQKELQRIKQEEIKTDRASQIRAAQSGGDTRRRIEQINEQIGRLNAKKIRIAFSGSGEGASATNVQGRRTITPETAMDVLERTQELSVQRAAEEAEKSQNMQPPIGWGTTEYTLWKQAATDGMDAIWDEYNARMEEAKGIEDNSERFDAVSEAEYELTEKLHAQQVRQSVLEGLIAQDEETQTIRSSVPQERISMLCEREVASALGDDARVQELTNALLEAGYAACWPEEDAAVAKERAEAIAYAKKWGDEAVRERLGITDNRELTEDDYYKAAHTDKGFWEWEIWNIGENGRGLREYAQAMGKNQGVQTVDVQSTEAYLDALVRGMIGENASIEQTEAAKNAMAVPAAITSGVMSGTTSAVQGAADMLEALVYESARAQYGRNLTREEMAILSPGYAMMKSAKEAIGETAQAITPDVSGRGEWVQTIKGLTQSVTENIVYAKAGSAIGKVGALSARMLGVKDAAALQRAYNMTGKFVRNAGFTLSGFKSGLAEANAEGLDNAEAIIYAAASASISMAVENLSIDPFTREAQAAAALPDALEAAKQGIRKATGKYGVEIFKSSVGEGLEEVVEEPLQKILQKFTFDPDMAWIGKGGVIDPEAMLKSGVMGTAAGAILAVAAVDGNGKTKEKTETKKPTTETAKPITETAQTETETAQQTTETEQQTKETAQTETETEQPTTETEQPTKETEQTKEETGKEETQKKAPEQIAKKAADYEAVYQVAADAYASADTKLFASLAAEEIAQRGELSEETRAEMEARLNLDKLKNRLITQDMAMATAAYGSRETSEATKAVAEKAITETVQSGEPMSAQTRRALWTGTARDAARATAQAQTVQAREELEKATKDLKAVKKEYGQMNGRLSALTDNATQMIQNMISGAVTTQAQGQYQTALSKINTLRKRVENQKERVDEATAREKQAREAYEAAQAQAKAEEEAIFAELMSTTIQQGMGKENVQAQQEAEGAAKTQQGEENAAKTQQEADPYVIDRMSAQELASGNEQRAKELQNEKRFIRTEPTIAGGKAETKPAKTEQTTRTEEQVWDRYEDYDIAGMRKYLKNRNIYVNEKQAAEIKAKTGMSNLARAGMQYGLRLTNKQGNGTPLETVWTDMEQYLGILAPQDELNPEVRMLEILDDVRRNEQEMRDPRNRFMSVSKGKRTDAKESGKEGSAEKTAQQIAEELRSAFPAVSIREGSSFYNLKLESGQANVQSGSIRVVGSDQVSIIAHEIGHTLSLRGGINDVQRTAAGRVMPGSVKVNAQYADAVDAMVEKMQRENPDVFAPSAYDTQEARRQEAIAEYWTRLIERGAEAAREFAGDELDKVMKALPTRKEMKALKKAHAAFSQLKAQTLFGQGVESVVEEESAIKRELKAIAGSSARDLLAAAADKNIGMMAFDKKKLESLKKTMSKEEWKAFVRANKKAGRTNLAIMDEQERKQYIETGETDAREVEQTYVLSANRAKAQGVVGIWIDQAIIGRDGRVLMDKSISEMVKPIGKNRKEFGAYHMLLQELDARNLREKHQMEYEARKAMAPGLLEEAQKRLEAAEKERRKAKAGMRVNQNGQNAQQEKERAAKAEKAWIDARQAYAAAKQEFDETRGGYVPRANDSYRTQWADASKAEIEAEIARVEKEYPAFKQAHAELCQAYRMIMEDQLISPGYIENAQKAWENVTEARPHYLPTRVVKTQTVQEQRQTSGATKSEKEITGARAGDRDVINPITAMVSELTRIVKTRADMELKNQMVSDYDTFDGLGEFMREITGEEIFALEEMINQDVKGEETHSGDLELELIDRIQQAGTNLKDRRVMVAIENGKKRYFEITNQTVFNALEGSDSVSEMRMKETAVWKAAKATARMVTNLFRSTTTLLNPFFGTKNAVADIMTSTLQGQKATYTEAIRGYVGAMIESFQYQFGGKIRAGSELNKFAYMGGLEGDAYSHDVESARKKLQDVFREDYVKERGKLRALWETGVGAVEKFNDAIESGMRYYQFRQGLKTGQSMQRAFRMSQEATVDFSKTGFKTKEVAQFFYFLNANVQDTYGIWHMIEQNQFEPGRATRMMARTIVRATVMNMAWEIIRRLFWSDEDKEKYNAAADNVKAENYILGYVGDTAIMLPKGKGVLFAAADLPRNIVEGLAKEMENGGSWQSYVRHVVSRDVAESIEATVGAMNPFTSSVFQTAFDLSANKNHWGDEIVPSYMQGDARSKTDARTSEVADFLSWACGGTISPKAIHYAIDQQMGWCGDLLLAITTPSKTGKSWEESDGLADYVIGALMEIPETLAQMAVKGFTTNASVINDVRSDFYDYADFFEETISQYDRTDGDAWYNKQRISAALSDAERESAYEDAKDMKTVINQAKKAMQELSREMDKRPEDAQALEEAITQILITVNQAADSWQRRYMNADLSVEVRMPKGGF